MFSFFSESYVELLISTTTNLGKEKEEAMKQMLTQSVNNYFKYNDHSRDEFCQAIKSFNDYLIDVYKVHLVTLAVGSLIITLDCPTLESLDRLWRDYNSGHLDKLAEEYLVTDKLKKRLNLETVCLKTTITKENYLNCRKALMELSSTSSGEFNKAFGKYGYIVPEESSLKCLSVSRVYNLQAVLGNNDWNNRHRHYHNSVDDHNILVSNFCSSKGTLYYLFKA